MILNKSSMERGLAHGTIVKCENVNLRVRLKEKREKENGIAALWIWS